MLCLGLLDQLSVSATPASESNFTACFDREVPLKGVVIKAQWVRADFGRRVPVYDTDASALSRRLSGSATWGETGDRERDPSPDEIFTIRLRNGERYRLVGLHIMTKELRHWQWISLWWSDKPDEDFGADRPSSITESLAPVWRNYKMCAVDGYVERDADPASKFDKQPMLAAALAATSAGSGGPTWCSNPYMERGRNNARTNCIGCHQHGGATVAFGDQLDIERMLDDEARFPQATRARIRNVFPADYLFAFNRVDDFSHMIEGEVGFHDAADSGSVAARIASILRLSPDIDAGTALYSEQCAVCHGTAATDPAARRAWRRKSPSATTSSFSGRSFSGGAECPAGASPSPTKTSPTSSADSAADSTESPGTFTVKIDASPATLLLLV